MERRNGRTGRPDKRQNTSKTPRAKKTFDKKREGTGFSKPRDKDSESFEPRKPRGEGRSFKPRTGESKGFTSRSASSERPPRRSSASSDARPGRYSKDREGGNKPAYRKRDGEGKDRERTFSGERPRSGYGKPGTIRSAKRDENKGDRKPYKSNKPEGRETRPYRGKQKDYSEDGERGASPSRPYSARPGRRDDKKTFTPRSRTEDSREKRSYKPRGDGDKKPYSSRNKSDSREPSTFRGRKKDYPDAEDRGEKRTYKPRGGDDKKPYSSRGRATDSRESSSFSRGRKKDDMDAGERTDKRPYKPRETGSKGRYTPGEKPERRGAKPYAPRERGERDSEETHTGSSERPYKRRESSREGKSNYGTGRPPKGEVKPYRGREKEFSKEGGPERERTSKPVKARSSKRKEDIEENNGIRLNRYIANAGISSRREADNLIKSGVVTVNGKPVTEMGFRVSEQDVVRFNDRTIKPEKSVYILLNKPKDFITTMDDPEGRRIVTELVKVKERVFPVGRLDRNTTGVLLLTNDGDLAERLMHPKYQISKIYLAILDKNLKREDMEALTEGIELEDGVIAVDEIAYVGGEKNAIGVQIHSGRNRIVHRMFEHLGYKVDRLDRTSYAGLTKKDLKRGDWRELTKFEVLDLQKQMKLKGRY